MPIAAAAHGSAAGPPHCRQRRSTPASPATVTISSTTPGKYTGSW